MTAWRSLAANVPRGAKLSLMLASGPPPTSAARPRRALAAVALALATALLVSARARVELLSVASGASRWRSTPELGEGIPPLTSISRVIIARGPPLDLPQLYIADAGCSTAGTGYGVAYDFAQGFEDVRAQPITGPRLAGRCARWHTLSRRVSPDEGQGDVLEVMLTDERGLHAFDVATGERTLCGQIQGMPPSSVLPYRRVSSPSGPAWVVSLPDRVTLVTPAEPRGDEVGCEPDERVLRPLWSVERVIEPLGLTLVDYNRSL